MEESGYDLSIVEGFISVRREGFFFIVIGDKYVFKCRRICGFDCRKMRKFLFDDFYFLVKYKVSRGEKGLLRGGRGRFERGRES